MSNIMTYQVWMSRTSLAGKKRGSELRALDSAILSFQVATEKRGALLHLRSTLCQFIAKKSGGAVKAVGGRLIGLSTKRDNNRTNGMGPVSELYCQVEAEFGAAAGSSSGSAASPSPSGSPDPFGDGAPASAGSGRGSPVPSMSPPPSPLPAAGAPPRS